MIIFPFFFSQDMYKNICQEAAIDKADDREDGKDMCDVAERLEQRGIQRGTRGQKVRHLPGSLSDLIHRCFCPLSRMREHINQ